MGARDADKPMDLAQLRRLLDWLDGVAMRLEDVLVLSSLDRADYPHATRKLASWILLGMGRLARQLPPPRIPSVSQTDSLQAKT